MNIHLIFLSVVLFASAQASNLVYQSPYMPESAYAFKSKGGKSHDYLIDGLNVRGIGGDEIDGHEALTVKFDYPVVMQNIQLGLLFSGDVAELTAGHDVYRLEAYGFNQAHYLKNGVLIDELFEDESTWTTGQNLYGMWTLHDPFGSSVIKSFTLSAPEGGFGLMSFNTLDQALVHTASANSVPDGAPVAGLLALSLLGIVTLRGRVTKR